MIDFPTTSSADENSITQEFIKDIFNYDPETGVFTFKKDRGYKKSGSVAGYIQNGYVRIEIDGKSFSAHRLAWIFTYGHPPTGQIDHANMVRSDNRILNLRDCSVSQNQFNVGIRSDNTSGFKGVSWNSSYKKWIASARMFGKKKHLGSFDSLEKAVNAYREFAKNNHGEFLNLGNNQ